MIVLDEVSRKKVKAIKPDATTYIGESAGLNIKGVGQVIIIAADRDQVCEAFKRLAGEDVPVDKNAMHKIALIKEKDIEV